MIKDNLPDLGHLHREAIVWEATLVLVMALECDTQGNSNCAFQFNNHVDNTHIRFPMLTFAEKAEV